MDARLSRRERKKQETRERLLETALRLFREQGYETTTVEQIADAADVAKGTFFNYFETKEAILPALVEWRLQKLQATLEPEQGAPVSPVARIKLALRLIVNDPLADHALVRQVFGALAQQRQAPPALCDQPLIQVLATQVRQAQAAGEIRADLDAAYVACVIQALFSAQMIMWHCDYRPTPLPEMLDAAVDLLLDGVAGPQWRK